MPGTLVRLSQVDFDGTVTLSEIKVMEGNASQIVDELVLYPNPVSDAFIISFGDESPAFVTVHDQSGRTVYEREVQNDTRVEISAEALGLEAGMYILRTSDQSTPSIPFIVR